ncbi:MAG: PQQ-binding-like beta-propeller repeat protein, partial [Candidatus Thioglobus sp.]
MRIAAIFSVTALLIGCAQPAAKPNASDRISVTKVWSTSNVAKTNNKYLRLKPVFKGGKIFTANANGNVYALDAKTGDVLWRNKTATPISSGVSVSKNNVFWPPPVAEGTHEYDSVRPPVRSTVL